MYVNPCDKYFGYFTDGIAMYFDNGQLDTIATIWHDTSGVYPFVNPQVSNPTGNVLNDTMNWVAVSGTFVANGTETFLTIGNFKTDAATTIVFNPATYIPPDTIYGSNLLIDDVSVIEVNAANWLHDTTIVLGDSAYIGLPIYEVPDAMWYDINMNYIGKGSGIKVKPLQWATQYIQAIDVCSSIRYDTMTVWAAPLSMSQYDDVLMSELNTYPNPANDLLNIELPTDSKKAQVSVYNMLGETILLESKAKALKHIIQLPVGHLAKGFYTIRVDADGKRFISKFVKE